jgi:hypothetical protein
VEAILFAANNILNDRLNPVLECIILTMMFMLCTLARVSETLLHPYVAAHQHVMAKELFLVSCDDSSAFTDAATACLETADKYRVLELVISRTSAKNDLEGVGNNFSFRCDDSKYFNFVQRCLFDWAKRARPKADEPFFSYQSIWALKYDQLNKSFKTMICDLGFKGNVDQSSTHSLPIGGTSILAAAGMADCVIQKWEVGIL